MKKFSFVWRTFSVLVAVAMLASCEGYFDDDDDDDDLSGGIEGTDTPSGGDSTPIYETMTWSVDFLEGFRAHIVVEDRETLPQYNGKYFSWKYTGGLCISETPFSCEQMVEGNVSIFDAGYSNTIEYGELFIDGLLPNHTYYARVWIEMSADDKRDIHCSSLVTIETPDASPFSDEKVSVSSIKDIILYARLAEGIHYDKAVGGYDVEFMESEMTATYRKLNREYETWEDADTKREGLAVNSMLEINLHNLMPGQKVRIRPWITIGDERYDGEWVEGQSSSLATEGHVQIGAFLWAATNVGAAMPYEVGELFDSPLDVSASDDGFEVPWLGPWNNIINSKPERWVCGTLEGVDGWFVIDRTGSIFLPFTWRDEESGVSFGDYWGSDPVPPTPTERGYYMFFRCSDYSALKNHQYYGLEQYDHEGKNPKPIRLVKPL